MPKTIELTCTKCNKSFLKEARFAKEDRNYFCGSSCAASHNNKKRPVGKKRSKLELWLEPRLTEHYSHIDIHFNKKDAIGSELDIYIPSLKLAIEVNGRFHYVPVFGQALLEATQRNDREKAQSCKDNGIKLVSIDASGLKFLTHKKAQRYFMMIVDEIEIETKDKTNVE